MGALQFARDIYEHHYRYFLVFTTLLLLFSAGVLVVNKLQTGHFIEKGVTLKGGVSLRFEVSADFDVASFQSHMTSQFPTSDFDVRRVTDSGQLTALIIEASDISKAELASAVTTFTGTTISEQNVQNIDPRIGSSFFRQMVIALAVALVFMSIVVFIAFKESFSSLFIVVSSLSTIITTLAFLVLLDVRLTSAGLPALLALIGYSIDAEILLKTRVQKRQEGGSLTEKTLDAMRTGVTQTGAALAAVLVGYFLTNSEVIAQIMLILAIGLTADCIYSWMQSATIMRWYLEHKKGDHHAEA